jgi:hypothetical protein
MERSSINLDKGDLAFHRPQATYAADGMDEERRKIQDNPYRRVVGCEVKIIGNHHDKGLEGLVKDVNLQGLAKIQLNIFPIRFAEVQERNWTIIESVPSLCSLT